MFVSATLEGIVVTVPDLRKTSKRVPVANFAIATQDTTWVVAAWADLATEVLDQVQVRDHVQVTGTFADSGQFVGSDGITRTRIEVRAQSVAPNPAEVEQPAVLTLRGTVATEPDTYTDDDGRQLLEVDVRTSRIRRGEDAREADITFWPVTIEHPELIAQASAWRVGDPVVVTGHARPLVDPPPETPQVEVWARSAGRDLYSQDLPLTTAAPRPTRSRRGGHAR